MGAVWTPRGLQFPGLLLSWLERLPRGEEVKDSSFLGRTNPLQRRVIVIWERSTSAPPILARDPNAVLAKVEEGAEVVVERDHPPVATIRPPSVPGVPSRSASRRREPAAPIRPWMRASARMSKKGSDLAAAHDNPRNEATACLRQPPKVVTKWSPRQHRAREIRVRTSVVCWRKATARVFRVGTTGENPQAGS